MADPRIPLKNPLLAGILAFLIPGAGHLYQGRMFKAAVFGICITVLFFTGMAMADWKAVQAPSAPQNWRKLGALKFAAQAGVGLPSLAAYVQYRRYIQPENAPLDELSAPITAPFTGDVIVRTDEGFAEYQAKGQVTLEPAKGAFGANIIAGRFEGTADDAPVTYELGGAIGMAQPISGSEHREVIAEIVQETDSGVETVGELRGAIPRPLTNWLLVPLSNLQEQELHRQLGKYHEVAMVFTWVAGLLNVLVIWDAVEGPAYGYGDEVEVEAEQEKTA